MNSLGFKQGYGKQADGKLITHILKNSFYCGKMYANKWDEYRVGKHQPIIDEATWERAYMNTFGTKRKNKTQDSSEYPLKGILFCGNCNRPQTSSNPRGRNKNYKMYECHQDTCKHNERIGIDEAHKQFLNILSQLKPTERVLKLFSALVFEEWDVSIAKSRNEASIIENQVTQLENKLTTISESNSKGILSDDEAKARAEETRREIAVLKIERFDYKIEEYDTETVKNFTEAFLTNLDKLWMELDLAHKQQLQQQIFPKGLVCKNKKVRTTSLASSFELMKALKDENFNLVIQQGLEP